MSPLDRDFSAEDTGDLTHFALIPKAAFTFFLRVACASEEEVSHESRESFLSKVMGRATHMLPSLPALVKIKMLGRTISIACSLSAAAMAEDKLAQCKWRDTSPPTRVDF